MSLSQLHGASLFPFFWYSQKMASDAKTISLNRLSLCKLWIFIQNLSYYEIGLTEIVKKHLSMNPHFKLMKSIREYNISKFTFNYRIFGHYWDFPEYDEEDGLDVSKWEKYNDVYVTDEGWCCNGGGDLIGVRRPNIDCGDIYCDGIIQSVV